ncbi:FG-GAP-like repeat-containing protein [Streptomyces sp. NBC_01465]|uniref:FG-GAP-like repeat-containing protein n=1 Tax=Streptomyces sp. NBC_01465 TaxID=2903878 RepID=UPI002E363C24|nr:FG-GAP-like repeat-containing protein [Streptomyces sp. NBC_01465]
MARRLRGRTTLVALAVIAASAVSTAAAAQAPTPVQTSGVWGIDFSGGVLNTVERAANGEMWIWQRHVPADGTSTGDRSTVTYAGVYAGGSHLKTVPCEAGDCVPLVSSGNGHVGVVNVDAAGKESVQIWTGRGSYYSDPVHSTDVRIQDVNGAYYAFNAGSPAQQYVEGDQRYRYTDVRMTRAATASSVWGTRLWTASSTAGAVTSIDIVQKKVVETVATGAPCAIKEVQSVGRWVYWNCGPGGAAGVYDRTAKKSVGVAPGSALLGDGYLVQHDRAAGKLVLTDFHTGVAGAPRAVADLPAGVTVDQRRQTWAVDRFGGNIAYVGTDKAVHIVPSGVPAQPPGKIASDTDDIYLDLKDTSGGQVWASTWQLNREVTWTFTVKDASGRAVRVLKGGPTAEVDLVWDGKTDAGSYTYNGPHTWTLTATATQGSAVYTTSGSVVVSGGRQGFHDQGADSLGDLITLNASGGMNLQFGQRNAAFYKSATGSGWPAGTVAVPFADTGSDRCSELLVRMPTGELRRYTGRCGNSYTPANSHASLGGGWQQYDVLTSPGDLNGDGRADLIARQKSTGDMYFYAGIAGGKFAAKVKLASNWKTYGQIAGVGDITGDGRADLVAHDKAGGLWRYNGLGNGKFAARVKVFSNWGTSYNAIIGVGDITGDGKADLVERDTGGRLFRNTGNGKGSFGGRTQIATGWQTYKGIF